MNILVIAAVLAAGAPAADDFITRAKGKIAISTEDLPTAAADMERLLKPAVHKTSPYRVEGDNSWSVNLVAVLKKEARGAVHVVFYDKDDKAALHKHAPVRAIEVNPAAHNKLLQVPQIEFNADQGFVPGKTYIVRVTELDHNHEVVLAETLLTLTKAKHAAAATPKDSGDDDDFPQ